MQYGNIAHWYTLSHLLLLSRRNICQHLLVLQWSINIIWPTSGRQFPQEQRLWTDLLALYISLTDISICVYTLPLCNVSINYDTGNLNTFSYERMHTINGTKISMLIISSECKYKVTILSKNLLGENFV